MRASPKIPNYVPVSVITYFTQPSRTIAATLRTRHISMAPLAPFWGRGVGGEGAAGSGSVADQESRSGWVKGRIATHARSEM